MLVQPGLLPNTGLGKCIVWEATTTVLASVTSAHNQMQGKKQLTVNEVTGEKNVWLADILEPCILDLDGLQQLGGTVDKVSRVNWVKGHITF